LSAQPVLAQQAIPLEVVAVIPALTELLTQTAALVGSVEPFAQIAPGLLYLPAQQGVGPEVLVDQATFVQRLAVVVAEPVDILALAVVVGETEHPPLRAVGVLVAAVDMAAV
jgi:hypothetical protein